MLIAARIDVYVNVKFFSIFAKDVKDIKNNLIELYSRSNTRDMIDVSIKFIALVFGNVCMRVCDFFFFNKGVDAHRYTFHLTLMCYLIR